MHAHRTDFRCKQFVFSCYGFENIEHGINCKLGCPFTELQDFEFDFRVGECKMQTVDKG